MGGRCRQPRRQKLHPFFQGAFSSRIMFLPFEASILNRHLTEIFVPSSREFSFLGPIPYLNTHQNPSIPRERENFGRKHRLLSSMNRVCASPCNRRLIALSMQLARKAAADAARTEISLRPGTERVSSNHQLILRIIEYVRNSFLPTKMNVISAIPTMQSIPSALLSDRSKIP